MSSLIRIVQGYFRVEGRSVVLRIGVHRIGVNRAEVFGTHWSVTWKNVLESDTLVMSNVATVLCAEYSNCKCTVVEKHNLHTYILLESKCTYMQIFYSIEFVLLFLTSLYHS